MADLKIGVIGGSGLGRTFAGQPGTTRHEMETPFGKPSDAILESSVEGLPVFFLSRHGPGHVLNPTQVPYRANIFALKQFGVTHIIASGAVGSLREEFRPRDLAIANQIIDKTSKRAATFFDKAAVHVEFADPFCPKLRELLLEEGKSLLAGELAGESAPAVHDRGCYVCMEGPAFSTKAESLMHRLWGGDLIGMTCMPEAKLAREAEIGYALVALVTDYDCWKQTGGSKGPGQPATPESAHSDPAALLKEIIANLDAASENAARLIRQTLNRLASDESARSRLLASPALSALKLAIWSDKSAIDSEQVELLRPIWIKYFE